MGPPPGHSLSAGTSVNNFHEPGRPAKCNDAPSKILGLGAYCFRPFSRRSRELRLKSEIPEKKYCFREIPDITKTHENHKENNVTTLRAIPGGEVSLMVSVQRRLPAAHSLRCLGPIGPYTSAALLRGGKAKQRAHQRGVPSRHRSRAPHKEAGGPYFAAVCPTRPGEII